MSTRDARHAIRFLTSTDSYKLSHHRQYPARTTRVYSNLTARKSRLEGIDYAVFFGLQAFLHDLSEAFDDFVAADVDEAVGAYAEIISPFVGVPATDIDVSHIRALHRLGFMPLEFRALPEGTVTPIGVPMLTVENTHPDFGWLTNYVETVLSAALWQPIVSASKAHHMRLMLDQRAMTTTGSTAGVEFQGHDFSYRGMAGTVAASASGAAHLLSFRGSDCVPASVWVADHYGAIMDSRGAFGGELASGDNDRGNGLIAASVPATEHSVMCAGGQGDELGTFKRLLDLYPTGILSVVSDTWDLWTVLTEYLPALHDQIMARDGKLVIRPDSGDPADIICGDPTAPEGSPEYLGVIRLLYNEFGGSIDFNGGEQGYLLLDPHVGAIYGDGITYDRADDICTRLAALGFASTNVVFGVGSYTYQGNSTRDSLGMAMKATWAEVDGVGHDLFKDPITDDGEKRSAKGRLAVLSDDHGEMSLVQQATSEEEARSLLRPVWRDGRFERTQSFAEIRATLADHRDLLPALT